MSQIVLQDSLAVLIGFAFGFFAYWKQIGAWGNVGVFVMGVAAIKMCPNNDIVVCFLIAGAVFGIVAGITIIGTRFKTRAAGPQFNSRSWQSAGSKPGFGSAANGDFEDVDDAADDFLGSANYQFGAEQAPPPPPPPPVKDYYAILGVERTASEAAIKLAYHQLIKTCHPDLFPGDREKETLAKDINEAYDILMNPQKRAAFNRYGVV